MVTVDNPYQAPLSTSQFELPLAITWMAAVGLGFVWCCMAMVASVWLFAAADAARLLGPATAQATGMALLIGTPFGASFLHGTTRVGFVVLALYAVPLVMLPVLVLQSGMLN